MFMLMLSWQNTEFVFDSKKEILPLKKIVTYDYDTLLLFFKLFFIYTEFINMFVSFWTDS